jgi:hypothetical protein
MTQQKVYEKNSKFEILQYTIKDNVASDEIMTLTHTDVFYDFHIQP